MLEIDRRSSALDASQNVNKADSNGKRIGILIVAYNAVSTLRDVLKRISPAVWQNVTEVVVFDDASHDATYELAVGYREIYGTEKLHIIKNQANLGYGGNQKAGYAYFIQKGFDIVVLLHGDGQYAPEILHHLYHPIVSGQADAVFGSRMMGSFGRPLKGGMPLYKYMGNRILSAFENRALGMKLTEFHSGYRAYDLHALSRISMNAMTNDFHFDTEIIIKLHHQGFRIKEVPIPTYYGDEICYVNGMKYACDVFRAVRRYKSTIRSSRKHSEFAEYFINDPHKTGRYSSHSVVQRLIGANQSILDVGCGDGYFAQVVRREGNRVTGTDIIPAPRHRDAFDEYVCADLSNGLAAPMRDIREKQFDRVLLMDVLQQLPNPEKALRECAQLLTPSGRVLVSLPNVANITVRINALLGRFDYSDRGILDRRHLRFYNYKTACSLLERCGFRVTRAEATTMPLEVVLDLRSNGAAMKFINWALGSLTQLWPGLLAYQWVLEAMPAEYAAALAS